MKPFKSYADATVWLRLNATGQTSIIVGSSSQLCYAECSRFGNYFLPSRYESLIDSALGAF